MIYKLSIIIIAAVVLASCGQSDKQADAKIMLLHHSTGRIIWHGGRMPLVKKAIWKIDPKIANAVTPKAMMPKLFANYNKNNQKKYHIEEVRFPEKSGNNPYDYYNAWVNSKEDSELPIQYNLDKLTKNFDVIIFKHCYSAAHIRADKDSANANSSHKSIENYKLQYNALKEKMHTYPDTKFVLFVGAAEVESQISLERAQRANTFFNWVKNEWDLSDDNIYLWDFYQLQTEGGLFFKNELATSPDDSHPNDEFATVTCKLLFNRIVDVIENDGTKTSITGSPL